MRLRELEARHRELREELARIREDLAALADKKSSLFDPEAIAELIAQREDLQKKEKAITEAIAALEAEIARRREEIAEERARRWREEVLPKYHQEAQSLEEKIFSGLEGLRGQWDELRRLEDEILAKWHELGEPLPRPKRYSGRDFRDFLEPAPTFGERERRLRRIWRL